MAYEKIGEYDGQFLSSDRISARQIIGEYIEGEEIVLGSETAIIRSENFVPGSSGFLINGAGNVEFNDVTVRGDVISSNWSGAAPEEFGPGGSSVGFYLESTLGVASFQKLFASGLEIRGDSQLIGDLTMLGDLLLTSTSGGRIQMLGDSGNIANADGFLDLDPNNVTTLSFPADTASSGGQNSLRSLGDSGLFYVRAGEQLDVEVPAGTPRFRVQAGTVDVFGDLWVSGTTQIASGNAGAPGLVFTAADTTGLYLSGSNVAISTGGTGRFIVGSGFAGPVSDNAMASGSSGNKWTAVWAVNGTIQTSDRREKKGIRGLKRGLAEVMQLRPVSYKWKKGADKRTHWGLIAQEVQEVLPEGPVIESENGLLSLPYHELIPLLVNAIQELKHEIEDLQSR